MILTQNSIVLHTNELDAIETDTYKNRTEIVMCGSSMCRSKTSVSKIIKDTTFEAEKSLFNAREKAEILNAPSLSDEELQQFNAFGGDENELGNHIKLFKNAVRDQPLKEPGKGRYSMSPRTKTKIRQKMVAWSRVDQRRSGMRFIFITLTLTSKQIGTDKDYSSMLNTFFTYLRKYYPTFKNYLYVNEIQSKSTFNLHTHIVTDSYISVHTANRIWCKILKDNGYTFNGQKDFQAGKGGANPVDIKKIFDIKRVQTYVTKYVTKNDSSFDCLIWNCSQSISKLFTSAKIWDSNTFSVLFGHVRHVLKAKLTNGDTLHIHLLSQYNDIQARHFKINESVLKGTIDREKFIEQIKEQCKSNLQLQDKPKLQTNRFNHQSVTC